MELGTAYSGSYIGGGGGEEKLLLKPGAVVTGVDIQSGLYFGAMQVVHMSVYWRRLERTGLEGEPKVSEKQGSGKHADDLQPVKRLYAPRGAFISDFVATSDTHTSGESFIGSFEISTTEVVH